MRRTHPSGIAGTIASVWFHRLESRQSGATLSVRTLAASRTRSSVYDLRVPVLTSGDRIDDYAIVEFLAEGGNGEVYIARHPSSGREVALKILSQLSPAGAMRFEREIRVLRQLDHPGIVRLHAHGQSRGHPYLVMDLLRGETLEQRLQRGPLDAPTAVAVVQKIASALEHAHARGVIHRDLKPGNVFLGEGDPPAVTVLDFGIARQADDRKVTRTGALIGTPAYMAPEQARGESTIDARADLFALGCVLYEAMSGRQAFEGEQFVAVLAKILLDEPPRLREVVPGIPSALDDLVARLLAKEAGARPTGAEAVVDALAKIDVSATQATVTRTPPIRAAITESEQRLVSAILVRPAGELATTATLAATREAEPPMAVRDVAERHGATMVMLVDGTILLALSGRGNVADQAASGASCALAVAALVGDACVALATGRAETTGPWPVGPVIDRAADVLARGLHPGEVGVDDLTARLLEASHEIHGGVLRGARVGGTAIRTLLGRPTPCVGREKELALLDATLAECISEPVARAVLVTAPPGIGKTRLRTEFLERARTRGDVAVWLARSDPVGAGSSLGLVRQLVRSAIGLREGDPAPEQQARLDRHLARLFSGDDLVRARDFLGELVAVPSTAPGAMLRAARSDPTIMGEWLRRTFEDWIGAECAAQPLLVVIEDLHWGDASSVGYLASALRRLAEQPLFVLALARPEVHELFPKVWSEAGAQEIRLAGLTRRAAERLVRAALGDAIADAQVQRVVARADGNAYYLEELIRRVAEGGGDELPETVIAMVQSRFERLEPEARRVLRAASVFGEVFWQSGVIALLGVERAGEVARSLAELVRRELIAPTQGQKFPGEVEYGFRHGLLREATYATLAEGDRPRAHRLAAEWLERAGEKDPLVLADHIERGGDTARAIPWLLAAAKAAYDGLQYETALTLSERAIANGAQGEGLGALRRLQATSAAAIGDWHVMREHAAAAMEHLPRGSALWVRAASGRAFAEINVGNRDATSAIADALRSVETDPEPNGHAGFGDCIALAWSTYLARGDLARWFADRLARLASKGSVTDPLFEAWVRVSRLGAAWIGVSPMCDVEKEASAALETFDRLGDVNGPSHTRIYLGNILAECGVPRAVSVLADARAAAERIRYPYYIEQAAYYAASAHAYVGRLEEAARIVRNAAPPFVRPSRGITAWCHLARGALDEAAQEARIALDGIEAPIWEAIPTFVLASVALRQHRPDEALRLADAGIATLQGIERINLTSLLRLVRAEALHALGNVDDSRIAIAEARDRIERIAGTIVDPEMRASYLTNVEAHARTLTLARAWLS